MPLASQLVSMCCRGCCFRFLNFLEGICNFIVNFKSVNLKKYDFELFFQVWPLMGKQYSLLLFVSHFLSRFM